MALPWRDTGGWDELEGWRSAAACRDVDTNLFFPAGDKGPAARQIEAAKAVCRACPVREECLAFAMAFYQEFGIWGGLTEDERRSLRRTARARMRRVS